MDAREAGRARCGLDPLAADHGRGPAQSFPCRDRQLLLEMLQCFDAGKQHAGVGRYLQQRLGMAAGQARCAALIHVYFAQDRAALGKLLLQQAAPTRRGDQGDTPAGWMLQRRQRQHAFAVLAGSGHLCVDTVPLQGSRCALPHGDDIAMRLVQRRKRERIADRRRAGEDQRVVALCFVPLHARTLRVVDTAQGEAGKQQRRAAQGAHFFRQRCAGSGRTGNDDGAASQSFSLFFSGRGTALATMHRSFMRHRLEYLEMEKHIRSQVRLRAPLLRETDQACRAV